MSRHDPLAREPATAEAVEMRPNPVRRPFDRRDLDRLPKATEQDPPYRPWWVVDARGNE